ncbi:MAG: hypothetical protein HYU02_04440 [Thaumarchaeota archaeon]|nr:hypothetical protein [Nitrososphaerota archaeon]
MGVLHTAMDHLKNHIEYPATKEEAVAACNNFMDIPKEDADWFAKTLPKGTYKNPDEVVKAILQKV